MLVINNLLLTEREGRTGEYRPEVVAVRTERSKVRAKTTEGQYSPIRLKLARLVSSLLYVTSGLKFNGFKNQNYAASDRFYGNGRMAESRPRRNQSERQIYLETTLPYNKY